MLKPIFHICLRKQRLALYLPYLQVAVQATVVGLGKDILICPGVHMMAERFSCSVYVHGLSEVGCQNMVYHPPSVVGSILQNYSDRTLNDDSCYQPLQQSARNPEPSSSQSTSKYPRPTFGVLTYLLGMSFRTRLQCIAMVVNPI